MMVEPRLYNWCGTRGYGGNPYGRWAGGYFMCPLSEFLIVSGWAQRQSLENLSDREQWRLEGTDTALGRGAEPWPISQHLQAFRFDPSVRILRDIDTFLESSWRAAPSSAPGISP